MVRIAVQSEMAIVAVSDSSVRLPCGTDQDALIRVLEPMARAARVFYLVTDDPVHCRIDVLAGEQAPGGLSREFEPCGDTFGLELPTGRLAVHGWGNDGTPVVAGTVEATAGAQVLSVLARRPFEGTRHAEDMTNLLGTEWKYMERVNRLGLVGCLPVVILVITVLAQKWQWLWFVLPLLTVSWAPYMLLKQGRRYKSAERRAWEEEQARPHYVFSVMPSDQEALAGGFLRV